MVVRGGVEGEGDAMMLPLWGNVAGEAAGGKRSPGQRRLPVRMCDECNDLLTSLLV